MKSILKIIGTAFKGLGDLILWAVVIIVFCVWGIPTIISLLPIIGPILLGLVGLGIFVLFVRSTTPMPPKKQVEWIKQNQAPEETEKAKEKFGNAHFQSAKELSENRYLPLLDNMHKPGFESAKENWDHTKGLIMGLYTGVNKMFVRYPGNTHILTFARTRSGKGVGTIIPNLLEYSGSMIVIDPKGENMMVTERFRRDTLKQKTYVLNPWNLFDRGTDVFNPLDLITEDNEDYISHAQDIAQSLIQLNSKKDSHWGESAQLIFSGLVLHVALDMPEEDRNLMQIWKVMSLPSRKDIADDPFNDDLDLSLEGFFEDMSESTSADGRVSRAAHRFMNIPEKERGSIVSTMMRNLRMLDLPQMEKVLGGKSTMNFEDLRKEPGATIYIVVPDGQLNRVSNWMRSIITCAFEVIKKSSRKKQVLFLLDEAASLGHLEPLADNFSIAAGYNIKLWCIFQTLVQLQKFYKGDWETLISGSACLVFGVNDNTTAEYFSKKCGTYGIATASSPETVRERPSVFSETPYQAPDITVSWDHNQKNLMNISDFSEMKDRCILFDQGNSPIELHLFEYYNFKPWIDQKRFDPNPYHEDE